ncbi:MAG: glycosyltransferase family 39 protein [Chloroflexota bacterium]
MPEHTLNNMTSSASRYLPRDGVLWLGVLLLLFAAAVRLIGLADFAVWTDEGFTVWVIEQRDLALSRVAEDRHPPLYFVALAYWQDLTGLSRLALRLPTALSGVFAVALVYRIGLRLGGVVVATVAALLMIVTPSVVYYTQEIRHFGWLLAAVCFSSWLFLQTLRKPTVVRFTAYALSVAAIMYVLYIGFFVILAQLVIAWFVWRGSLTKKAQFAGAWALALGLFGPWLYVILTQQFALITVGIEGFGNVEEVTFSSLWRLMSDVLGHGLVLLLPLTALGLWAVFRRNGLDRVGWGYVIAWGLGAFVVMGLINPYFTLFRVRTVLMLVPGFALLAGLGLAQLPRWAAAPLIALLIALTAYREQPIQARGAMPLLAQAMAEDFRPDDVVVVETGWSDDEFIYEIRRELGWDIDIVRTLQWVDGRGEDKLVVLEIEDRLRAAERIWVIHWNQPPSVVPWLQGDDQDYDEVRYTRHTVGPEVEAYQGGFFARVDGDYRLYLFVNNSPTGG